MRMTLGIRRAITTLLLITVATGNPVAAYGVDQIEDGQWFHAFLHSKEAQATSRGAGVTVAVLDSGVDATHPDLSGSVLPGKDFVKADGDGRVDAAGHGTAMAGLIVAHGRVAGIAPDAKILPVRFTEFEPGESTQLVKAIRWATAQKADVISISIGMARDDPEMRKAVREATDEGIIVVASAGNTPVAKAVEYPAAYPDVLAVGCIDKNGDHAAISVKSSRIDIVAPCVGVTSANTNHAWSIGTGTSSATAIVAGAVALVQAAFPGISGSEVRHRLTATAVDKGPVGHDVQYGFGVVDLVGALTADVPPLVSASATVSPPADPSPDGSSPLLWALGAVLVIGALALIVVRSRRRG
ncbi:type VII secretion-associated serine protease [Catellatospora methionotrophica]|uniref:Type VII secretion-associated serine protease n=1 Tax=Catellatospora methionotrophica TaxID=121620 RepID=A0A8J3L321_9ACTN|nr:S8 family serine peptidase [Catellatospora methionotrophica]GIG13463.1 type VII secretion-associated serine protease [Catellatospora methionotrophica]